MKNKFYLGAVYAVLVVMPFWCIVIGWFVWRAR